MARFVLANRKSGKFSERAKMLSRSSTSDALGFLNSAKLLYNFEPQNPAARRITIIEADPREIALRRQSLPPDVILEPEIFFWKQITPPRDLVEPLGGRPAVSLAAALSPFQVKVTLGGHPVANVMVLLYLRGPAGGQQDPLKTLTDGSGVAKFNITSGYVPAAALILPTQAWSMLIRAPLNGSTIDCPPLPNGPSGWWHEKMNIDVNAANRGAGVKIGHVDTGCGPHPYLRRATRIGAFIDGRQQLGANYGDDVDDEGHGTHTAGIIAAEPQNPREFAGIAPSCTLYSIRVFASAGSGAKNEDIANAVDYLAETEKVDLINLSLGGTTPSEVVHDAIDGALENGTLCICAAGNNAGEINYPAAFPSSVAVSALGLAGWGPAGSLAASRLPSDADRFGESNLFLANFSCYGSALTGTAPGVGVISTVPDRLTGASVYAVMDGTSMAAPAVCGTLAAILATDPNYLGLSRDLSRAHAARTILSRHLTATGLAATYQGGGLPKS